MNTQGVYYDQIGQKRYENYLKNPKVLRGTPLPMDYFKPHRIVFKIISQQCSNYFKGTRILDLACGQGYWSCYLASLGAKVASLDISGINVKTTKLRAEVNELRISPFVGDASRIGIKAETFDIILGNALIHHLTEIQEIRLYQEVFRLLKKGGCAVFMESLQNSSTLEFIRTLIPVYDKVDPRPSRLSKSWKLYVQNDPHPHRSNTTQHYRDILGKSDFKKVEFEEIGIFSRLDRFMRNRRKLQRWIHDVDYFVKPLIPFNSKFCRNIVITAWK